MDGQSHSEIVNEVARVCIEKYGKFFQKRRTHHSKTQVDIIGYGLGAVIGAKLAVSMNMASGGGLPVENFVGNLIGHIVN